ncbi:hypothetical protein MJO29_004504 [Puccinia striiformis f. sp. tritici]|uniref:Zinc finger with UFM1-specific peptidase domain protein n=1 Tax=Puccinia striiformis TaxID=27350 RepID=A0A2S4UVU7_9BASI|nr:hypothetical protein MJO29_004504 [Puccinia striiformis f. sp. tritici]POW01360.1 hypothetical protein PSHT_12567 [Puccinia striiformis]
MQGNYRTAQPTGLGHLPTLLARLAIPRGWTDPFSEPLRPVECAHIGTSSKNFRLGTGDWAGGCGYRNLQMLFSTVIAQPLPLSTALLPFTESGYHPDSMSFYPRDT